MISFLIMPENFPFNFLGVGNVGGRSLRSFPAVTPVCQYGHLGMAKLYLISGWRNRRASGRASGNLWPAPLFDAELQAARERGSKSRSPPLVRRSRTALLEKVGA